jgi:hypothetical protein
MDPYRQVIDACQPSLTAREMGLRDMESLKFSRTRAQEAAMNRLRA